MPYRDNKPVNHWWALSLIIPTLWFMRASSKGISFWLGIETEGQDYLEGSSYDRNFYLVLMFLGVFILLRRHIDWVRLVKSNMGVFLFFLYIGASLLWSPFPQVAFRRYFHTLGDLIMILVIITEIDVADSSARILRRVSLILLLISIVLIKYYRALGVDYDNSGMVEMWTGVSTHKNTLGQLALMGGLYCIWDLTRKKHGFTAMASILFTLAMVVFILIGSKNSNSVTATITFVIGCAILLLFAIFKNSSQKVVSYLLVIISVFGFYSYVSQFSSEPGGILSIVAGSVGKDPTLTGRTELWNALIAIGAQHFPQGIGYGSFWIGDIGNNLWETFTWRPEQGHNGYIDVYVELGLIGLIIIAYMVIGAIKGIRETLKYDRSYGVMRFTLLMVALTHNITESSFGRPSHLMWLMFLLAVLNSSDYHDTAKNYKLKK